MKCLGNVMFYWCSIEDLQLYGTAVCSAIELQCCRCCFDVVQLLCCCCVVVIVFDILQFLLFYCVCVYEYTLQTELLLEVLSDLKTRRSIYRLRLYWLLFWCSECSLLALWLVSECSLSALWVLTDCWIIPDWLLEDLSQNDEDWLL